MHSVHCDAPRLAEKGSGKNKRGMGLTYPVAAGVDYCNYTGCYKMYMHI